VSWHEFPTDLLHSINAGSVDLHAEETSAPSAQAIIVPPDSPIRSIADLKGKRVAVAKGSGCNHPLLAALKQARLSINDTQVRYLDTPDALAAFRGGNVDAWAIRDPFLATQRRVAHVRTGRAMLRYAVRQFTDRGTFRIPP